MNFEQIIGSNFNNLEMDPNSYEIERNDFELELNKGLPERWFVTAKDDTFQFILNEEKMIETIFLYPSSDERFLLEGYIVAISRKAIRAKWGQPDQVGEAFDNDLIGFTGGFDRYDREIVYHFEYGDLKQEKLSKITLMSLATAP